MTRQGVGRGVRFGISLQVLLTVGLALAALLLVNWLAARPGIKQRVDLTERGLNTLSTATAGVLERLEDPVTIDVFFRPEEGPIAGVAGDAMQRVWRLLVLVAQEGGGRVEVRANDMGDRLAVERRLAELKIQGFENCVVVSRGAQRAVLRLNGDLAQFDPGRPRQLGPYEPASIVAFLAEQAIVKGILAVTRGTTQKLYFSSGHGERDLYGSEAPDLGSLHGLLVEDGFDAGWWSFDEDGPVPDDCAALAIVGPEDPFAEEELQAIEHYVDAGGRLVLAPHNDPARFETSGVGELAAHYGIEFSRGIVLQPFVDRSGETSVGFEGTLVLRIPPDGMANHPITAPLRSGQRSVVLTFAHRVKVAEGGQPQRGATRWLLRSNPDSWLDLPPIDYLPQYDSEAQGPFDVALVSAFVPEDAPLADPLQEQVETRIVALGAADGLCNYAIARNGDFARNLFNWVVSREYRVAISPRDPDLRRLPPERGGAMMRVALLGLPGVCLVLGVLTAVLRSGGSPRRGKGTA